VIDKYRTLGAISFSRTSFSKIGKTRFYQEHFSECAFPKKLGGYWLGYMPILFWEYVGVWEVSVPEKLIGRYLEHLEILCLAFHTKAVSLSVRNWYEAQIQRVMG